MWFKLRQNLTVRRHAVVLTHGRNSHLKRTEMKTTQFVFYASMHPVPGHRLFETNPCLSTSVRVQLAPFPLCCSLAEGAHGRPWGGELVSVGRPRARPGQQRAVAGFREQRTPNGRAAAAHDSNKLVEFSGRAKDGGSGGGWGGSRQVEDPECTM